MSEQQEQKDDLFERLSDPFEPGEVEWKPQVVHKTEPRCLAICYVDARCIMDRIDKVMGPGGWQDSYRVLNDGCVECTLSLCVNGQWVSKADVGGPSDQSDKGDRLKAAYSDAIKRAAVKWSIGRYLYRIDGVWCDYDKDRQRIKGTPKLPPEALPKRLRSKAPAAAAKPAPPPVSQPQATPSKPAAPTQQEAQAAAPRDRLVSEAEGEQIKWLMGVLGLDKDTVQPWFRKWGITRIGEMPARLYEEAKADLERAVEEKQKKAAQDKQASGKKAPAAASKAS